MSFLSNTPCQVFLSPSCSQVWKVPQHDGSRRLSTAGVLVCCRVCVFMHTRHCEFTVVVGRQKARRHLSDSHLTEQQQQQQHLGFLNISSSRTCPAASVWHVWSASLTHSHHFSLRLPPTSTSAPRFALNPKLPGYKLCMLTLPLDIPLADDRDTVIARRTTTVKTSQSSKLLKLSMVYAADLLESGCLFDRLRQLTGRTP